MSRTRNTNPAEAFSDLEATFAGGKPAPEAPTVLKLTSIKLLPAVFQHRNPADHSSQRHIRELTEAVRAHGDLAPVTVWWSGKAWACLDGHHRIEAYRRAGRWQGEIPVTAFQGSPSEALALAAQANTQDKLPMTKQEKTRAGWRLVCMGGGLSKATQARAAGVSERLIADMRATRLRLESKGLTPEEIAGMTWMEAKNRDAGREGEPWTEEQAEQRAQEMATAIRKALGSTAERQPHVFARAVAIYSTELARGLEDWFGGPGKYGESEQEADGDLAGS